MTRSTKVAEYHSDALNLIEAIHAGDLRTAAGIVMLYAEFDGAIDPRTTRTMTMTVAPRVGWRRWSSDSASVACHK
jgi:hypothetical protein